MKEERPVMRNRSRPLMKALAGALGAASRAGVILRSDVCDALASQFLVMQAVWWLRARISTRLYLTVHHRSGRIPSVMLHRWDLLSREV